MANCPRMIPWYHRRNVYSSKIHQLTTDTRRVIVNVLHALIIGLNPVVAPASAVPRTLADSHASTLNPNSALLGRSRNRPRLRHYPRD